MTQPWFQVFTDLPGHWKIGKLRDALGLKNRYEAVGLLICLWSWAAVHAPSGELGDYSAQDLADAAGWRKSAKKFRDALVSSGLVDQDGDRFSLHDWDAHQGMFQDALSRARQKNAERQRRLRERRKQELEASQKRDASVSDNANRNVTHDVTVTFEHNDCNGPTSTSTSTNTSLSQSSVVLDCTSVTPDGGDGTDRDMLRLVGGEVGQGVLLLSEGQMDDLLEKLGVDGFNAYAQRLVGFVRRTGANIDHYRTLLKWWREDTATAAQEPEILRNGRDGT